MSDPFVCVYKYTYIYIYIHFLKKLVTFFMLLNVLMSSDESMEKP